MTNGKAPLSTLRLKTQVGEVFVSTAYRQSSALVNDPPWYFETMAFRDGRIIWQSTAFPESEAQRQHDLAVRWFGREATS